MSVLRSEWTKFHTVRGWVIATFVAAAAIIGLGLLPGPQGSCGQQGPGSECSQPVGPDGVEVVDTFYFVRQPLTGDGSITVRIASMTGRLPSFDAPEVRGGERDGVVPWAKAGLIVKDGTKAGSPYAAIMLTGEHGVRMQYNYLYDTAGPASAADRPVWLRMTRTGSTLLGESSVDGRTWTKVDEVQLEALPSTVEAGLFVTSPQYAEEVDSPFGTKGAAGGPSQATAVFDSLTQVGGFTGREWTAGSLGGTDNGPFLGAYERDGDTYEVSGSGDIAPAVSGVTGLGVSLTQTLVGTFAGLIVVVVIAAMFATAEYRRGLIRTTIAATPARGRVLAAKAAVAAATAFTAGLAAAAIVVTVGPGFLRSQGAYVQPTPLATDVRLIVGTAALLAVAAVLATAIGVLVRRSAAAVTLAIVLTVLPYLLTMAVLPTNVGDWALRVTPAAAFAIQQSAVEYAQVDNLYDPNTGFFPLSPWAGFAVLVGWAVLAMVLATVALRRRDA